MNINTLLAGPVLRRLQRERITLWLATSRPVRWRISLTAGFHTRCLELHAAQCRQIQVAPRLYIQLIDLPLDHALPQDEWIAYSLSFQTGESSEWVDILDEAPHLLYPGRSTAGFVLHSRVRRILHGSCRKPHFVHDEEAKTGDGLVTADELLMNTAQPADWPALLVMGGDQVYSDDVAGPMLVAIHGLLDFLEAPAEKLPGATLKSSHMLHTEQPHYYTRDQLLPKTRAEETVRKVLFTGAKKPIFTTDSADNHLISLSEMIAMYLLVWSPTPWQYTGTHRPGDLPGQFHGRYDAERKAIEEFIGGLKQVQRVMAHLPVAMAFDDHDITDDWNLSAAWEQTAYGEPFSRRIIGNALVAYLICQGWGNAPENFSPSLMDQCEQALKEPGQGQHEGLITELLAFQGWQYQWDTKPVLMVLDTRTKRWHSEYNPSHPSGLMDWESLSELQQRLLGHDAVLLVSPAPIFGVKLIEGIQRVFTWMGLSLLVDAENWMAHPGAANSLLNLFRHGKTPSNFVILSGDVHYSFVYDVELRSSRNRPNIWQITSSGFRNEFPQKLLNRIDRLNRWMYAPWSPLNWFTKRRKMRVVPRQPASGDGGDLLVNGSGIGLLSLNAEGAPEKIEQLLARGGRVEFCKSPSLNPTCLPAPQDSTFSTG